MVLRPIMPVTSILTLAKWVRISCAMARNSMRVVCLLMAVRTILLPNGERFLFKPLRPMLLLPQRVRVKNRIRVIMDLPTKRKHSLVPITNGLTLWVPSFQTIVLWSHGAKTLLAMIITTSVVLILITSAQVSLIATSVSTIPRVTRLRPRTRQSRMIPVIRAAQM